MHQLRHALPGPDDRAHLDGPRVVVFVCGQPYRGDDAVGLLMGQDLPTQVHEIANVRVVGALAPEHLTALPPESRVVIVDAVVGPSPGEVIELGLAQLAATHERGMGAFVTTSSHQLPLGSVVALAEVLRGQPLRGRFVGVGIESVAIGSEPGCAVRDALPALRAAVGRAVEALS